MYIVDRIESTSSFELKNQIKHLQIEVNFIKTKIKLVFIQLKHLHS